MDHQDYSRLQGRIAGLEATVEELGRQLAAVKARAESMPAGWRVCPECRQSYYSMTGKDASCFKCSPMGKVIQERIAEAQKQLPVTRI